VQLEWGQRLLKRRKWLGNEIVMDAGAGSGNLTKILADKVPYGRVYAVDADSNMLQQAKANLSGYRNVQIFNSNMDNVSLPTKVDVVFSNAALHWVPQLERVLSHFWQLLNPNGELLIECGGHGNLDRPVSIIFKLVQSDQFREYFVNWKQPWHFPKQNETEKLLNKVGFRDIQVSLSNRITNFSDRQSFATFVKTVIMKPFLGYLPDAKKDHFLDAFLNEFEHPGSAWSLDYVRLNIFARR
jgi:trans-aconitate methyltransferase